MHKNDYQKKRNVALPEYISVISANNCAKIRIEDIEIIEQEGRKLHVVTAGKDYSFYAALDKIAEMLLERSFFRPIKGMIINLDHIVDISGFSVNFNSGQSIALGRNALSSTRKAYKRYLLRYPPYTVWEPVSVAENAAGEGDPVPEISHHDNKVKTSGHEQEMLN